MLCVILKTILLCSFSSSYAILKNLHPTPQGSIQVKVCAGLDRRLDIGINHADETNEAEQQMDEHTEVRNTIQFGQNFIQWTYILYNILYGIRVKLL